MMKSEIKTSRQLKIERIIATALEILRESGDQGLSMRQIATRTGMSLSNVQYYFRNKEALLKGMVDHYFQECDVMFAHFFAAQAPTTLRETVTALVAYGMRESADQQELNRIFRELWGIAGRNTEIEAHLQSYYRTLLKQLVDLLTPLAPCPDLAPHAVSLLLPYVSGYIVTSSSLPLDHSAAINMLTELALSILEGNTPITA